MYFTILKFQVKLLLDCLTSTRLVHGVVNKQILINFGEIFCHDIKLPDILTRTLW